MKNDNQLSAFNALFYIGMLITIIFCIAYLIGRVLTPIVRASSRYEGSIFEKHPEGIWLGVAVITSTIAWAASISSEFSDQGMAVAYVLAIAAMLRALLAINRISKNIMPDINYQDHTN